MSFFERGKSGLVSVVEQMKADDLRRSQATTAQQRQLEAEQRRLQEAADEKHKQMVQETKGVLAAAYTKLHLEDILEDLRDIYWQGGTILPPHIEAGEDMGTISTGLEFKYKTASEGYWKTEELGYITASGYNPYIYTATARFDLGLQYYANEGIPPVHGLWFNDDGQYTQEQMRKMDEESDKQWLREHQKGVSAIVNSIIIPGEPDLAQFHTKIVNAVGAQSWNHEPVSKLVDSGSKRINEIRAWAHKNNYPVKDNTS